MAADTVHFFFATAAILLFIVSFIFFLFNLIFKIICQRFILLMLLFQFHIICILSFFIFIYCSKWFYFFVSWLVGWLVEGERGLIDDISKFNSIKFLEKKELRMEKKVGTKIQKVSIKQSKKFPTAVNSVCHFSTRS